MKPTVIVDLMGSDLGPEVVADGVAMAHDRGVGGASLRVVGGNDYKDYLRELGYSDIGYDAIEGVIGMNDDPCKASERPPTTSVGLAVKLAATQERSAVVSFGNSGAAYAAAFCHMRSLVKSPICKSAIAVVMPTFAGFPMVLLDAGANPDPRTYRPYDYLDLGLMGAAYCGLLVNGSSTMNVGLLSNGVEEHKGNSTLRAGFDLMRRSILGGDLKGRYLGYAEGNDVLSGRFDVIVADGFTGNVALKLIEGVAFGLIGSIKKRLKQTTRGRVGGMLIKPAIRELMRGYDWRTHNGAPLLGVDGNVIIGHGKSDAVAVANAIDAAIRCAREDFPSILKRVLAGARRDFPDGYTKNLDK